MTSFVVSVSCRMRCVILMPAAGVDPYLCEHFMMNDQSQIHAEEAPLDFAFVLASSVHDMKNSLGMLLTTLATMMEQSPP